jgi:hypothetical protein
MQAGVSGTSRMKGGFLRVALAVIGVALLTAVTVVPPHKRTWADLEARRQAARRSSPAPRPEGAAPLGRVQPGGWAAGGPIEAVTPLGPTSWRVVVRLPSGVATVRVVRGSDPRADVQAAPFSLTAEPSAAPGADVLMVARVLAISLGANHDP